MGLITAAGASLASVLGDQWKEYFYCSEMDADVLVRKGQHHTGKSGLLNRGGSENVITNGSTIVVNEGQCMIIVDQGAIVDVCAQPGAYTYERHTIRGFTILTPRTSSATSTEQPIRFLSA